MILVRTDINSSRSLGLILGRKRLRCSLRFMLVLCLRSSPHPDNGLGMRCVNRKGRALL
ncbi:hypothetical protein WP1_011 [Pseudomonas phage WP1]